MMETNSDAEHMNDDHSVKLYSRESFEAQRARVRQLQKRDGWMLAGSSIALGGALIYALMWLQPQVTQGTALLAALGGFIVYLLIHGVMMLRTQIRVRAVRPICPHCGVELDAIAERVASDSGQCDACGERIIE